MAISSQLVQLRQRLDGFISIQDDLLNSPHNPEDAEARAAALSKSAERIADTEKAISIAAAALRVGNDGAFKPTS
jgi:hypothetical protein